MVITRMIRGLMAAALLFPCLAQAQLFRAYLSTTGNDGNACTLAAPCRLLPAALAAVADGGEVWMLDSGNFNSGPVTIGKSVTILAVPGALGSVVALNGNAINVLAPSLLVVLRNLRIAPVAGTSSSNGVNVTAASTVTLDRCEVAGMNLTGVFATGGANLRIYDTTVRDNGGNGIWVTNGAAATILRGVVTRNAVYGIQVTNEVASGLTAADILDTTVEQSQFGVYAISTATNGFARVSIRDSRILRNASHGVYGASATGAQTRMAVGGSLLSNNGGSGAHSESAGTRIVSSGNTVSNNDGGLTNFLGTHETTGDNAVRYNNTDTSGTTSIGRI